MESQSPGIKNSQGKSSCLMRKRNEEECSYVGGWAGGVGNAA